ncbi:response regulator receiver domain-containing protein [Pacificibacter maritimus]|uniref:Response regulator receiver domain-containing protein n=1 Tax=Pacificibacter maritimus TaxID=762213 RepID=A0A3N4U9T8_9RHOB|nr:response regulator [Pacificibacter maritimus]RPE66538.1 response regulator receiver domain-containing protein [Pacificibacter maritimus]
MDKPLRIGTVMTIDDDRVDQLLYKRIIKRSGIVDNVLSFQMAEDALDYLRRPNRDPIDVIFLDVNMPRMSGFDFLDAAVLEFGPAFTDCVVMMLTTSLDPVDVQRSKNYSMIKEFLNKPMCAAQLEIAARTLFQAKHSEIIE